MEPLQLNDKHQYSRGSKRLPSVSQICKFIAGSEYNHPRAEFYRDRGTAVHDIAKMILDGETPNFNSYYAGYIEAIKTAIQKLGLKSTGNIEQIYDNQFFSGKIDYWDNERLVDWKTGNDCMYDIIQLHAYSMLNRDRLGNPVIMPKTLINVYLSDTGKCQIKVRRFDKTICADFLAAQRIYVKYQF